MSYKTAKVWRLKESKTSVCLLLLVKGEQKYLSSFKVFSICKFVIIFAFCCFLSVQFVLFWWKYLYVLPRRPTWHFFSEDIDPNSHWLYTRIWRDWSQERGRQHKQIHTNKLSHTHTLIQQKPTQTHVHTNMCVAIHTLHTVTTMCTFHNGFKLCFCVR